MNALCGDWLLTNSHQSNSFHVGLRDPNEVRPQIGAAPAAGLANELLLNVGQPEIAGPAIGTQPERVTAAIVLATDHDAAHAHVALSANVLRAFNAIPRLAHRLLSLSHCSET